MNWEFVCDASDVWDLSVFLSRGLDTEELIIGVLRAQEAGAKTADGCREPGISRATFYKWKGKHGSLQVSDAWRLKALGDENTKLKKLLDPALLQDAEGSTDERHSRGGSEAGADAQRA